MGNFFCFLFLFFSVANSQSIEDKEYLKNIVGKNMMFYKIFFTPKDDFKVCSIQIDQYINHNILDKNSEYDIQITPFTNGLTYPDERFKLYLVSNNYYSVKKDTLINYHSFSHSKGYDNLLSENMLIAFNEKHKELLFISGYLIKNCIAKDFKLNLDYPDSFFNFLRFKLFNYEIENIELVKKNKKRFLFRAFSKKMNCYIFIKVDSKNFDLIKVITEDYIWTENGTYNWYSDHS